MNESTTPPTPSPSQPSQVAMELAERIGRLFSLASHSPYIEEIARLIDAHTAGLRREVERLGEERDMRRKFDEERLETDSIVASCGCLTKTNELRYHKPGCKYRLICERDGARAELARLTAALEERGRDGERLDKLQYGKDGNSLGYACVFVAYPPEQGGEYALFSGATPVREIIDKAITARAAIDAARSAARKEPGTPGAGGGA